MSRARFAAAISAVALLAIVWAAAGCADPIAAARNAVATAAKVEGDASSAFVAWDAQHQHEITMGPESGADTEAALKAYRAKRSGVEKAFQALWLATLATETAANLVEAGQKSKGDLGGYVTALMQTVTQLKDALVALGVSLPGGLF